MHYNCFAIVFLVFMTIFGSKYVKNLFFVNVNLKMLILTQLINFSTIFNETIYIFIIYMVLQV